METWLTRSVAILCAMGSSGLLWTFGVFVTVPWQQGRMLDLDRSDLQVIGVPLVLGLAVAWGALHIFALADRKTNPWTYAVIRAALILASVGAAVAGTLWSQARIA